MPENRLDGVQVCVFDAYGTLFDVSSVASGAQAELGDQWRELSELWRSKQLQYTWLRGLAGHHADFWQVTGEALDFALATLRIERPGLRQRLMDLYLRIAAYPEVAQTLARLRGAGMRTAILSNGSPAMLQAAVGNAQLAGQLDAVLSVESVGVFKPHPDVYRLACRHFQVVPAQVCFLSSNGWDAYSAKAFGFQVLWCNRFGQAPERLPEAPDGQIETLAALPGWLGMDAGPG
jgi:2-haloacid dehalogenase